MKERHGEGQEQEGGKEGEPEKQAFAPFPLKHNPEQGGVTTGQEYDSWIKTALFIVLNISSAVGIVMTNKLVFSVFNFKYGTVLTIFHFVITSMALEILILARTLQAKRTLIISVLPLALAFCGFVVLTNLSLQYNSVGFYQMAKVMTTPCVAAIQYLFYGVEFRAPVIATLAVTCIGVLLATLTEVRLTMLGLFFASSSVLVTALYQIWVGTKQKSLGLDALQLLVYQAPIAATLLIPTVPAFDNLSSLFQYRLSMANTTAIMASSLLAVLVNASTFLIIGRTSPITYNMVGHAKLTLILLLGYLFFDSDLSLWNLLGVIVALGGIFSYSYVILLSSNGKRQ